MRNVQQAQLNQTRRSLFGSKSTLDLSQYDVHPVNRIKVKGSCSVVRDRHASVTADIKRLNQSSDACDRSAYAALAGVWAQTQEDALRLQQLGAKVQGVTGNVKFDAQPDAAQLEQGQAFKTQLNLPVVMLASSREGEELEWLQALQKIQGSQLSSQQGNDVLSTS
jgi:hypothetical protein